MKDSTIAGAVLAALALSTFTGCMPAVEYRPTIKSFEAREEGCEFRIFRGYVPEPYLVLGRARLETFAARNLPTTIESLREAMVDEVCAAGGDGFLVARNPTGHFAFGLIVRFVPRRSLERAEVAWAEGQVPPDEVVPGDGAETEESTEESPEETEETEESTEGASGDEGPAAPVQPEVAP